MSTTPANADDFDRTFLANYAPLARILYRLVGDMGWAEELAAEAFWKLHRQPPASDYNLVGWLYRTGIRLALDHLKKRKRRAHYEALAPLPSAVQNPEEAANRAEQRNRVRKILAALKPEHSSMLLLRSEGHNLGEIASLLSLSPKSVGTFLARADRAFRKEYLKQYGE